MVGCFAARELPRGYDSSFEIDHDVTLVFVKNHGGGQEVQERVPAHKLVLSMASVKFRRMFYGSSNKGEVTEVMMKEGDSSEVFKLLVKYCYTNRISLAGKDLSFLIQMYASAASYQIPGVQSLVLKQKTLSLTSPEEEASVSPHYALDIVNEALQYPEHPRLVEALMKKAAGILRAKFMLRYLNFLN